MNKNFCLVIFFIFLIGCSIDNKSGIWSKNEKIKSANQYKDIIFEDNKEVSQELNKNIKIYLKDKYTLNNKKNYYNNNTGIKNPRMIGIRHTKCIMNLFLNDGGSFLNFLVLGV